MALSPEHAEELQALLEAMRDSTLPAGDEERLAQRVVEDAEVAAHVVDFLDLCAVLEWKHRPIDWRRILEDAPPAGDGPDAARRSGTSQAPVVPNLPAADTPGSPDPPPLRMPRLFVPTERWLEAVPIVLFCMLLMTIGIVLGYRLAVHEPQAQPPAAPRAPQIASPQPVAPRPADPRPMVPEAVTPRSAATLVTAERGAVKADGQVIEPGSVIAAGARLEISRGNAVLAFDQGSTIVVEGPTLLTIDGPASADLQRGVLVARVAHGSPGFQLQTGAWRIVDMGTSFGVRVDPLGAAELHVLEGAVEITSSMPGSEGRPALRVEAGEAQKLVAGDAPAWQRIPFAGERFAQLVGEASPMGTADTVADEPVDTPTSADPWDRFTETFDDAEIDSARWSVIAPGLRRDAVAGILPPSATPNNGRLELTNGCLLVTAQQFDATPRGVRVRVRWSIEDPGDALGVVLRANLPRPGVEFGQDFQIGGVRCFVDLVAGGKGPTLVILTQAAGPSGQDLAYQLAPFREPRPGETYEYELIDDGKHVKFTARNIDDPTSDATVELDVPSLGRAAHVILHNHPDHRQVKRRALVEEVSIEPPATRDEPP